jgi:hypothetical protein
MPPPTLLETTLLPFEGKIIYDSLLRGYNVYFGSGIRSSLNETYNLTSFKHFVRFLRDTERVPWEEAEAMLDELKG